MRRLAKQSRQDSYRSRRDYQTLHSKISQAIVNPSHSTSSSVLSFALVNKNPLTEHSGLVGFGGFLYPSRDCIVTLQLEVDSNHLSEEVKLTKAWNRIGLVQSCASTALIKVNLLIPSDLKISFWGLNADFLKLTEIIENNQSIIESLSKSHLAPETFYLSHEIALMLDIDEEESSSFQLVEGEEITLKKCSYCGRLLPLDMKRKGTLSFHKHKAKSTEHQNECRACKKWRINNSLNPLRTKDQLHESSVITRERKIFLRESEILQEIKERTGAGLKSQVWEKFERKCFYCGKLLQLEEVQLDHTRPLAYLWPIDEYATCLCADHNNQKREKFPIDFYTESQLKRLSEICGLEYSELCKKELNNTELQRILVQLPKFAKEWQSRTFAAIARKIAELRPDINLFEILKKEDKKLHAEILQSLSEQPLSIREDRN